MLGRRTVFASTLVFAWAACIPPGPKDDVAAGAGSGGSSPSAACQAACEAEHPDGVDAYRALATCLVCEACHDRCGAELGSACGSMDLGCSADATDCASCVASACALEQQPDTTFKGACALAGAECAASSDCVALNNCVASCVVSTGPGGTGGGGGEAAATSASASSGG
jgi:hypothetical protein